MNILGYRLRKPAPIPLARNAMVSSVPRALGLFFIYKIALLKARGGSRLLPFLCMG